MSVKDEKILMSEAAILYYEKKHTQQEIADLLNLSRQTVSKLLNDAVKENIVEIKIHNPKKDCEELEEYILNKFSIKKCIVTGVSSKNESLRKTMAVKSAVEYITSIIKNGDKKIALSWGRTIEDLINAMPTINTNGNVVFPLFGATDNEKSYFSSNELARSMADKIGADVKYAWFPYLSDNNEECELIKKLSCYKKVSDLWNCADIAVLGIGNTEILDIFGKTFGYTEKSSQVIGDIATHFFNKNGEFINIYDNTLCASVENIKNSRQTIAIACGDDKVKAISGALQTKIIDTLITDEYTAKKL
ncbi:MAG: winged helix-turn-helix transcriptional regulator [Ruminococcaceae bacterium]|nr:winged helix-turn-helix transcriptional regulator [Oscillospiraceae bacterium]